MDTTTEI